MTPTPQRWIALGLALVVMSIALSTAVAPQTSGALRIVLVIIALALAGVACAVMGNALRLIIRDRGREEPHQPD